MSRASANVSLTINSKCYIQIPYEPSFVSTNPFVATIVKMPLNTHSRLPPEAPESLVSLVPMQLLITSRPSLPVSLYRLRQRRCGHTISETDRGRYGLPVMNHWMERGFDRIFENRPWWRLHIALDAAPTYSPGLLADKLSREQSMIYFPN